MADPKYNKAAAVRIYALTSAGVEVPLRADASGNLVLAATIDTTNLALHTDVDGLEALVTATNTKADAAQVTRALLATAAKQDTLATAVAAMQTALQDPTTYTAITPSDSTNVTSTCTKGIFVAVTGNVNITGVGGSAVSLGTQIAGTTIPGALSRVNAATTATVFGLSGP